MKLKDLVEKVRKKEERSTIGLGFVLANHGLSENRKELRELLITIESLLAEQKDVKSYNTGMLRAYAVLGSVMDNRMSRLSESFSEEISDSDSMDNLQKTASDIVRFFSWFAEEFCKTIPPNVPVNYRYTETLGQLRALTSEILYLYGKEASAGDIFKHTQEIEEGSPKGTAARLLFYAASYWI